MVPEITLLKVIAEERLVVFKAYDASARKIECALVSISGHKTNNIKAYDPTELEMADPMLTIEEGTEAGSVLGGEDEVELTLSISSGARDSPPSRGRGGRGRRGRGRGRAPKRSREAESDSEDSSESGSDIPSDDTESEELMMPQQNESPQQGLPVDDAESRPPEKKKREYAVWGVGEEAVTKKVAFLKVLSVNLREAAKKCGTHARFFVYDGIVEQWNKLASERSWFAVNKENVKGRIRRFKGELKKLKKKFAKGRDFTPDMVPEKTCPYAELLYNCFRGDAFLHHPVNSLGTTAPAPPTPPAALTPGAPPVGSIATAPSTPLKALTSRLQVSSPKSATPKTSPESKSKSRLVNDVSTAAKEQKMGGVSENTGKKGVSSLCPDDPFLGSYGPSAKKDGKEKGPMLSALDGLSTLTNRLVDRLCSVKEEKSDDTAASFGWSDSQVSVGTPRVRAAGVPPSISSLPVAPDWCASFSDLAWPVLYAARIDEGLLPLMSDDDVDRLRLPLGDSIRLKKLIDERKRSS